MKVEICTGIKNGKPVYESAFIGAVIPLKGSDYSFYRENITLPDAFLEESGYPAKKDGALYATLVYNMDGSGGILIYDNTRPDGYCGFPGAREYVESNMQDAARSIVKGSISQGLSTTRLEYHLFQVYRDLALTPTNGIGPLLISAFQQQPEVFEVKLDNENEVLELTINPQCLFKSQNESDRDKLEYIISRYRPGTNYDDGTAEFIKRTTKYLCERNRYLEKLMATYDEGLNPHAAAAIKEHDDRFMGMINRMDALLDSLKTPAAIYEEPIHEELMPLLIGQPVLVENSASGKWYWDIVEPSAQPNEEYQVAGGCLASQYGNSWYAWHVKSDDDKAPLIGFQFDKKSFVKAMAEADRGVLAEFLGAARGNSIQVLAAADIPAEIAAVFDQMPEQDLLRFWVYMQHLQGATE